MKESGRRAVIRQSSCRSEPAAALRGLANGSSPARVSCRFMAAKCSLKSSTSPRTSSRGGPPAASRWGMPRFAPRRADGAEVPGDVLAGGAVAAGRARDQGPVLVDQLHRQAVQLRLDHVADGELGGEPQQPPNPGVQLLQLLVGGDVPEREHRLPVGELGEGLGGGAGDALGGRVGGEELRVRAPPAPAAPASAGRTRRRRGPAGRGRSRRGPRRGCGRAAPRLPWGGASSSPRKMAPSPEGCNGKPALRGVRPRR